MKDGGQPVIGSPLVTVKDEALRVEAPGCTPFDGEGVDARDLTLVDAGKVTGSFCDLASGRRLGTGSTGSASRDGYESLPGIRAHNLSLVPGTSSPEQILAGIDHGLWVWGLSGWWIGLDPSNDRFSSAVSGLWIEKGQPVRPVARVTVAGSLVELLSAIDMVGNDLTWDHSTKVPTFRLKEAAVSGV
jgi:PmbA protein